MQHKQYSFNVYILSNSTTDDRQHYEIFQQNKREQHSNPSFSWPFFHLRQWYKKGTQETLRWDPPARTAYHITVLRFNILQPAERWKEREKRDEM